MENGPGSRPPQGSPDGPKMIKKIEVLRAEEFGDPPQSYDYYDQETIDGAEKYAEEELGGETLLYTPFYPGPELRRIRNLSPEEEALPAEERREIRAVRLAEFKGDLMRQKEGIARTISELHKIVESSPGATTDILLLRVQELAPDYLFNESQIEDFKRAIEQYQEKHKAVEKYRAMYPNDANLFEACFGKKPKGKIEVVKGPMTLYFRCFNRDDYAFVSSFYKHGGDEAKIEPEDFASGNSSAGVALSRVKIADLAGAVTAENVGNNSRYELIIGAEKIEEIHEKEVELFCNFQRGDIDIEVKGVGIWKVKTVEHDENDQPLRIQILDLNRVGSAPMLDVIRFEPTEEMRAQGNHVGFLKRIGDGRFQYKAIEYLKNGNTIYGSISMDRLSIKIEDRSPEGTIIRYKEDELTMVPIEEGSNRTRIHEDQHQFNKLFRTFETREDMWAVMRRVASSAKTPEEAVQQLIHSLVRLERKWIRFDSAVRDEALAQYKGGRSPEETFHILTTSELYDYAEEYKSQISEIPAHVREILNEEISEVFYQNLEDGDLLAVDAKALEIEESQVQPFVGPVFKDEYKADLKKWLNSMSILEQKGYARDEVVALLYQESINSWPNLARRMRPKKSK